ncbi:MAG TPA: VTC domain-containing protein [Bacteroidales bacterium]|nr:VTC domain-containing protein [Bacteroidales bacterium]
MKPENITYQKIESVLHEFRKTDLETLSDAHFSKRYEKKFIMHESGLEELLKRSRSKYVVLDVDHHILQPYSSYYFDTARSDMYLNHHNYNFPRYKIRYREYHSNDLAFLEVKMKDNKTRTFKRRVRVKKTGRHISRVEEENFIRKETPYNPRDLSVILSNDFYRVTMAEPKSGERITLDTGISFYSEEHERKDLEKIVVIEIKTGRMNEHTLFENLIPTGSQAESSFSKYCIGRIFFDRDLKYNNFKPVLNRIEGIQSLS